MFLYYIHVLYLKNINSHDSHEMRGEEVTHWKWIAIKAAARLEKTNGEGLFFQNMNCANFDASADQMVCNWNSAHEPILVQLWGRTMKTKSGKANQRL